MPETRDFVTIVSGLPRSGTSLMMQLLNAGGVPPLTDQLRAPDANNPRGYFEFEAVKQLRRDRSWLANARGKSVKIIHLLLSELPADGTLTFRVILMRRAIAEVLASQRRMLARDGKPPGAVSDEQLGRIFLGQMEKAEQQMASSPAFRVLQVEHRALLTDPAPIAEQINQFLGGGLNTAAMVAAVDPSLYRERGQ
ncbi:MAG: sulfotransferase family protein [Chthoniobacterales bacterium]